MRRSQIVAGIVAATVPRTTGAGGIPDLELYLPGSDVFPFDEFHVRRGLVGGTLSRCWFAVTVDGTTYDYSFQHAGSRADPTVHVASHSGRAHRFIDLGASANTPAQVVTACIAALALDGITAVDGGAVDSRRSLVISGATSIGLPPAVTPSLVERGAWGAQRDDWGSGAVTLNGNGGTTGTGSIHVGNPNTQAGMAGRTGRVLGVYLWAHGGHAPRLAAFTGPAYSLAPTALTPLGQAVASAIGGVGVTGFGGVLFADAAAFGSADNLWAAYRENIAGGPRYRLHAQTPVGRGDVALNQQLIWDTTASSAPTTAFGATYTPTPDATFGIYISIGVIFELQDASGNYPADGSIDTWIGDQNTNPAHGTQFGADPTFLTGETTHHRFVWPEWTAYSVTQFRRAYQVVDADETSRIAIYGPWATLAFPASPAPALISDLGVMGVLTPNAYTTLTLGTPLAMESYGGNYVSVGANYVRSGGALATMTLPVFLDATTADNSWLNAWEDDRTTWHDDIIGASGARALSSGTAEYRTRNNVGMPNTDPATGYPSPMAVEGDDDSPNAIALEATHVVRAGIGVP